MQRNVGKIWDGIRKLWLASQTQMSHRRWGRFEYLTATRRQECIQHAYSMVILAPYLLQRLQNYIVRPLDAGLYMTAVAVHDLGEGMRGMDVPFLDKKDKNDRAEYLAFCELCQGLQKESAHFERAFLLQFCLKNPKCFSSKFWIMKFSLNIVMVWAWPSKKFLFISQIT